MCLWYQHWMDIVRITGENLSKELKPKRARNRSGEKWLKTKQNDQAGTKFFRRFWHYYSWSSKIKKEGKEGITYWWFLRLVKFWFIKNNAFDYEINYGLLNNLLTCYWKYLRCRYKLEGLENESQERIRGKGVPVNSFPYPHCPFQ